MVEFRQWLDEGDGFRWRKQLQIVGWIESKSETKVEDEFMISFLFLMMAGSELEIRHSGHVFSNAVKYTTRVVKMNTLRMIYRSPWKSLIFSCVLIFV